VLVGKGSTFDQFQVPIVGRLTIMLEATDG